MGSCVTCGTHIAHRGPVCVGCADDLRHIHNHGTFPNDGDVAEVRGNRYQWSGPSCRWNKLDPVRELRQAVPKPIHERAFWIVWRPDGTNPTRRHDTHDSANAEAERLAETFTGRAFYVMRFTGGARAVSVVANIAPGPGQGAKYTDHDSNPEGPQG